MQVCNMERIRLLITSDVHGHIFPKNDTTKLMEASGLARFKTVVNALKDENTLVLDNGDILAGTPLSYFHAERYPDDIPPVTKAMNDIAYDYVNIGNHDFDYGEEILMMHLQNLKAPCITNNWQYYGKPFGPTYVIREIAGKKIAIFGLVTSYTPHWQKKANIRHCRFTDVVETAKKTVDTVRRLEKPDLVICMYHGGFENDPVSGMPLTNNKGENEAYRLCREVSGIDLLIAGHQHCSMKGKINNTYYIETAAYATEIGCVDIDISNKTMDLHLLKCDAEADEDLMKLVEKEQKECEQWLDTEVSRSTIDLSVSEVPDERVHKSNFVTLMNTILLETTHADIASTTLRKDCKGLPHSITMRDIFSLLPYEDTVDVCSITGAQLREYLERSAELLSHYVDGKPCFNPAYIASMQYTAYDMLDGVEYTIDTCQEPGSRITSLMRNGKEIEDEEKLTIAMNHYRRNGTDGYDMLRNLPVLKEFTLSQREMIAQYLSTHPEIDFEPVENIHIL